MSLIEEIKELDRIINTIIIQNFTINTMIQKRLQFYGLMGTRTREIVFKDLERLQSEIRTNEEVKDYLIKKQIQLLDEHLDIRESEDTEESQTSRSRTRSSRRSHNNP